LTLAALGKSSLACMGTEIDSDAADQEVCRLTAHYQITAWVSQADLTTSL